MLTVAARRSYHLISCQHAGRTAYVVWRYPSRTTYAPCQYGVHPSRKHPRAAFVRRRGSGRKRGLPARFLTARRASEPRRGPETVPKVPQCLFSPENATGSAGVEKPEPWSFPCLTATLPYTFVSCDDADLCPKLICNPVWRCKESPGTQGLKDRFLTPPYVVDYNRRLRLITHGTKSTCNEV